MTWQNWARTVRVRPRMIARPADESELAHVISQASARGMRVKAVGSGHSFTAAAATEGVLVRTDELRGLQSLERDHEGRTHATVGAGTTIHELNTRLAAYGFGLTNMGDVAAQTVSGAISTGTHGTGRANAALSAAVTGLRIALPDGSLADVNAERDSELYHAARLGLGALGVLTAVTFRIEPTFRLRAFEQPAHADDVLDRFHALVEAEDHVEFYWLPFTNAVQLKRHRRTGEAPSRHIGARLSNEVVENAAVATVQRITRAAPPVTPRMNRLAARLIGRRTYVGSAPAVLTSTRRVRFHEMEYALPRAAAVPALRELQDLTARGPWRIAFPVEVRVAPADDVWLSPAYGRDTVYIAIHAYPGTNYRGWFQEVERLWTSYSGRPHWGKLHTRDLSYLRERYERMDDFLRVRDHVDPRRTMTNLYLDRVLGR